jgi:uncharacterized membrane protein YdbT with pleckstrin-like domain
MGYVDSVLQPGETVLYVARRSRVLYLPAFLMWVVAGLLIFAVPAPPGIRVFVVIAAVLIFALGVLSFLRAWLNRVTTEIAVTNRRVIYKRGLIRRYTVEMHMDKVESVDVDQSIWGRLLSFGDVIVHGTGVGLEPLTMIDHPLELRNHITAT